MPRHIRPRAVLKNSTTFARFIQPLLNVLPDITPLESKGNHPLTFLFAHQALSLVYYHLQQFVSGLHLLQALREDTLAQTMIALPGGIAKSTFFEAIGSRGLEQFQQVFSLLATYASTVLPKAHAGLGALVVVDPTLIVCTLSMTFADYRTKSKKMQAHIGYDPHRSTPRTFVLTDGKANARKHVTSLVKRGETGVMDRGFQCYADFDFWTSEGIFFVCRIKNSLLKTVIHTRHVHPGGKVLSDEDVILGDSQNCTIKPVRLVVYRVGKKMYSIATNRFDLTAEQIAQIYRLRWAIEVFFAWWKRFMNVYHLISRSQNGLAVQLLAGLITYLLLAIYCHEQFGEKVSIQRLREIQISIRIESIILFFIPVTPLPLFLYRYAKS